MSVIGLAFGINTMHFPFKIDVDGAADDVVDIFNNQLVIDMGRPYINGRRVDEDVWMNLKKIIIERCMPCFPVHYPALYIKLHHHKVTERAIATFNKVMDMIKDKGCPCHCHSNNDSNTRQ